MSIRNATIVLSLFILGTIAKLEVSARSALVEATPRRAASPVGWPFLKSNWRVTEIFHRPAPRHNIAIIVDSTSSMAMFDKHCGKTELSCALSGVQTLLRGLRPCRSKVQSCSPAQADALDAVSVFTFPNIEPDTVVADYDCGAEKPQVMQYIFPPPPRQDSSATQNWLAQSGQELPRPTYQIVPFSTDYRTPGKSGALNPGSAIVRAMGGAAGCAGIKIPGGMSTNAGMMVLGGTSTYFAGAIYAAQSSLDAERLARPGSSNVLVLIGDGDANAPPYQMQGATNSGIYPSWINECEQAVVAAHKVSEEGARIYAVSYGAASIGCPTDMRGGRFASPCRVMQAIASSPQTFFTVGEQETDCPSSSWREKDLNKVFARIAKSILRTRPSP